MMASNKLTLITVLLLAVVFYDLLEALSITEHDKFSYATPGNPLLECRTSHSLNSNKWNELNCCVVDPDRLLNATASSIISTSCNYTLTITDETQEQLCSTISNALQPFCCQTLKNWEWGKSNVTLVNNCNGQLAIPALVKAFSEEDSDFGPIKANNVTLSNLRKDGIEVTWWVSSCKVLSALELYDFETSTSKHFLFNDSDLEGGDCQRIRKYGKNLENLAPHTTYEIRLRQRRFNSPYWSQPTTFNNTTMEDVPLKGPEMLPGPIKFHQHLSSCNIFDEPWFNFTFIWKQMENNTINRGVILSYLIDIQYKDNQVPLFYDTEVKDRNFVIVSIDVQAVTKKEAWCSTPFTIEIWAKNSAGNSSESSIITVQLDELLQRRQNFVYEVKSPYTIRIERTPEDTDSLVAYYLLNGIYMTKSYPVSGRQAVPFDLKIDSSLQQNDFGVFQVSADNFEVLRRTRRSTSSGIVEFNPNIVKPPTGPPSIPGYWIGSIVFLICLVVAGVIAFFVNKSHKKVTKEPDLLLPVPPIHGSQNIYEPNERLPAMGGDMAPNYRHGSPNGEGHYDHIATQSEVSSDTMATSPGHEATDPLVIFRRGYFQSGNFAAVAISPLYAEASSAMLPPILEHGTLQQDNLDDDDDEDDDDEENGNKYQFIPVRRTTPTDDVTSPTSAYTPVSLSGESAGYPSHNSGSVADDNGLTSGIGDDEDVTDEDEDGASVAYKALPQQFSNQRRQDNRGYQRVPLKLGYSGGDC